jgi:hypothetical protein
MKLGNSSVVVSIMLAIIVAAGGAVLCKAPAAQAAQAAADRPRALLHLAAEPPRLVFSTDDPSSAPVKEGSSYGRYLETQRALFKSRLVLDAALRAGVRDAAISQLASIKNRTNPVAWLEHNLDVTNLKDTELLQVSLRPDSDCSAQDQVAIINAVVQSYMGKVVNGEQEKRMNRLQMLKKLSDKYAEILQERRHYFRSLRDKLGGDGALIEPEKEALSRLLYDLMHERVQLILERAEAVTLLDRRKKAENATKDPAHKEISAIEDRLAVAAARQTALERELERVRERLTRQVNTLDLESMKEEIAQVEEARRKIVAEAESLTVELNAPPQVRVLENATLPGK